MKIKTVPTNHAGFSHYFIIFPIITANTFLGKHLLYNLTYFKVLDQIAIC